MKIMIAGAWPFANGPLHIGHIAALLPGDVLARYFRAKGDEVYYVSGSDCHGTPIAIRARQEGRSPEDVSDAFHQEFCACFEKLGFSYDEYGKTSSSEHQHFVQAFHRELYHSQYIYEKQIPQAYCPSCKTALADRFIKGICPACSLPARGDQCEHCGLVLEPAMLVKPVCTLCGQNPQFRESKHLMLALSQLAPQLQALVDAHPHWRRNAVAFTNRYIGEGLPDRPITRDLDWGIQVPKSGYEGKKIYIWAENVLGYLSMSQVVANRRAERMKALWAESGDVRHYYVHGKDNIPFHTIILPSLLLAHGGGWRLPDEIISSEYLTLEGRKISTSENWAIWISDLLERYQPDSIRYFMITNGPQKRDADFSWREFICSHNHELLAAYGNFIQRTLMFIWKYYDGIVPDGEVNQANCRNRKKLFADVGAWIEKGQFKQAIDTIFDQVRQANRYFDYQKPWETRITNPVLCRETMFDCVQMIAAFCILLHPFLPFSSQKIKEWLSLEFRWELPFVPAGYAIPEPEILFERIDASQIEWEINQLSQLHE